MTTYRLDTSKVGQGWTIRRDGRAIGTLFDTTTRDERHVVIAALDTLTEPHGQPRGAA